jgi:general secretion pathway protein K
MRAHSRDTSRTGTPLLDRERRGFALVAALWLLVALMVLGLELSLESRARRLAAANIVERAQALAAASAGTEQTRSRLTMMLQRADLLGTSGETASDPGTIQDPWRELAVVFPDTIALGISRFHVVLADANASLNLNRADEDELRRLFAALRVDAGVADRLAQAIADWRDTDDLPRPRGAERELYIKEGLDATPANAPFRTLGELREVRGMNDTLYALVRPYLTIEGTGLVNLNAAPRPVALAIEGMTEEAVYMLQRARDAGRPIRTIQELELALTPGARALLQSGSAHLYARAAFDTREVSVDSEGWTTGSPVRVHVTGLAVRAGRSAFFVGRRSE